MLGDGPARRAVGQSLRVQLEKWAARAGRTLALAATIHELTGPLVVKMMLRDGVILCCFQVRAQLGCRESTTAYLLKGMEGGCNDRERVEYAQRAVAGAAEEDASKGGHSLLSGHQVLAPNSDATRLRSVHPSVFFITSPGAFGVADPTTAG